jgi:uncharacterized SAM-binding protein YcdF (DUF218 family)
VFFFLSKTLDALLSPLTWSIALITIGLIWPGRTAAHRLWVLAGLAVLLLFSFEPFANALERSLEREATRTYHPDVTYDAIILLGGLVDRSSASGAPAYNDNVERLTEAYDLLRTNHARAVIVSGGVLDPAVPNLVEADVLAHQLADWGIARERIAVEAKSRNTRENAVESNRIVQERRWTRLLLITSAFHMHRAEGCFRAVGLSVDTLPVDYRAYDPARFSGSWLPRASNMERSTMAVREWFGGLVYRVQGYAR